jgi:hypothetical protein
MQVVCHRVTNREDAAGRRIMIGYILHASNNKFTMVVFSVLSLAIIQSDWFRHGVKPFGEADQVIARTQANKYNPAVDVQLKIQIKEQRYCRPNTLQMVLSLDFINTGKDRLIFFKDGHRIAEYALSRTLENALAKKYELNVRLFGSIFFYTKDHRDISPVIDTPTPSDEYFIVIAPGEVYRSEESLTIPIEVNARTKQPDLAEGGHLLEVTLVTWPDIIALPDKFRERWKEYGYLYSKGITSSPVSFTFFKTKPKRCSR